MKRSFLTALGLEKDVIDQIMSEHGNTVELIKEKAQEDAEKQTGKLNDKITELQEKLDNIPKPDPDAKDWKVEYDNLKTKYNTDIAAEQTKYTTDIAVKQKEYDDYKTTTETAKEVEKLQSKKREVARKVLSDKKVNSDVLDDFMLNALDYEAMELDGDNIKDVDNYLKPYQEKYAKYFGTTQTLGTPVTTPPAGSPADPQPKTLGEALQQKYSKG